MGKIILINNINRSSMEKILFKVKVIVSLYDSWEWESLMPGITFCSFYYSVNHYWEFHMEDRGGNGCLQRQIKKEVVEEEITINLIVFEWWLCPSSVESLQWTGS